MRLAITILVAFLLCFWVGGMNSLSALRDAATCWLLALGKIIAEQGLPTTDPFSYTYFFMTQQGIAEPYVVHQWLSELFFYWTYQTGGLGALILLVSIITASTFVALPSWFLRNDKVDAGMVVLIGSLAQLACAFQFFARPEIFSYLLFAVALHVVLLIIETTATKLRLILIATYAALTALWCNLHTSFVLAIALALVPCVHLSMCRAVYKARPVECGAAFGAKVSEPILPQLIALPVLAVLSSLCNPAGFKLWTYLPKLFFLNIAVNESRSLNIFDLGRIELLPFFALFVIYLVCFVKSLSKFENGAIGLRAILACLAMVLVCARIRLIVYGLIIVVFELPQMLAVLLKPQPKVQSNFIHYFAIIAGIAGSLFVSWRLQPPQLPQNMPGFAPPFAAINYLNANPQPGPGLNEPRFGDMMIWYLKPPVPVFIDTRCDMYGERLFKQYAVMTNCAEGWQKSLQDFSIEWVFLPPDRPLIRALSADPAWKTAFKDQTAVILVKSSN